MHVFDETGKPVKCEPVDGREMIASGSYYPTAESVPCVAEAARIAAEHEAVEQAQALAAETRALEQAEANALAQAQALAAEVPPAPAAKSGKKG